MNVKTNHHDLHTHIPVNKQGIPVNQLGKDFDLGISIGRITPENLEAFGESEDSHRHDYHIFLLLQSGSAWIELDFEKHHILAPAVMHIHPNQVHRILEVEKSDLFLMGITDENINVSYLEPLEQSLLLVEPLTIDIETLALLNNTASLCEQAFKRKGDKLYASFLSDLCNAHLGLTISRYLEQTSLVPNLSRAKILTGDFKILLEKSFLKLKKPTEYATRLNVSAAYLNECVKQVTGFPVSHHIQQRVILETKRLLFHTNKSVKEIAADLGYDDPAYFSRLFKKITGASALSFKNKILE
ncbi:helix-turn-helix transcriptional regulator [Pedobacter nototheniae]|uniref:helix-turn-helix domain-containing protein n=1 Tax=Pedobacter nototheniae TaxID=2488994 RepID=UPI00292DC731|nr:helix-turn-helix transcriptional regulator [Pedobacter nototheniae]